MKYLILISFSLILQLNVFSQNHEFNSDGDLIYSDNTMFKLANIVDPLNIQFRQCNIEHIYKSERQALGTYIRYEGKKAKHFIENLKTGCSVDQLVINFPTTKIYKDVVITVHDKQGKDSEKILEFRTIPIWNKHGYDINIQKDKSEVTEPIQQGSFVWDEYNKVITAFCFSDTPGSTLIPKKYSQMIGYADCLVDTSQSIYFEDAVYGQLEMLPLNYKDLKMQEKREILQELRMKKVMGYCSMDDSPRKHARNIAIMSAEAVSWETFLRAHLNIMNDRFERASDGSWAQEGRGTYIKELEELEINTFDLLLGISLRGSDFNANHYNGTIYRVGRALAESKDSFQMENVLLDAIKDESLDTHNRILMHYLFLNYLDNLKDENRRLINIIKLQKAVRTIPTFASNGITVE